ncbi:MAG: tRNA uridine(34) 5-carboxymethylaminomethyl modification radical SAM/GNAT enzyme Elp3 [Candidatus Hodarchaeales archaeon]
METPQDTLLKQALSEFIQILIHEKDFTKSKIETLKRKIAKKYTLNRFLKNSEIISYLSVQEGISNQDRDYLTQLLQIRKVRTLSGIAVVAVMTKPSPCPGRCIYCPDVAGAPKSYTGKEPAAMRGAQNDFDPKKQVTARLLQLTSIGHTIDKVHLIIMGGTFLATPQSYQNHFIKECLDGITGARSKNLNEAKLLATTSQKRNVGITFETRPDYCTEFHVNRMLELGGTWVEIGVQTLSEHVLRFVQRNHTLLDVENAIRFARDGGLKITVHMMPNLFQTPEQDIAMFQTLYSDPRYIPDALKIYPTLVLENTKLYEMWKNKEYQPYSAEKVIEVIAKIKTITPPFIRIQRVQRDIPAYLILDGVNSGNLREMAQQKLKEQNKSCDCIRCREIGHQINRKDFSWIDKELVYMTSTYKASDGIEHFISYETKDRKTIFGFLRLREPSEKVYRPELKNPPATIIRELHVYGKLVALGKLPKDMEWQHRGIGKKLVELAEKISLDNGFRKMAVTSGLGVRDYYSKLGFKLEEPFMTKKLQP